MNNGLNRKNSADDKKKKAQVVSTTAQQDGRTASREESTKGKRAEWGKEVGVEGDVLEDRKGTTERESSSKMTKKKAYPQKKGKKKRKRSKKKRFRTGDVGASFFLLCFGIPFSSPIRSDCIHLKQTPSGRQVWSDDSEPAVFFPSVHCCPSPASLPFCKCPINPIDQGGLPESSFPPPSFCSSRRSCQRFPTPLLDKSENRPGRRRRKIRAAGAGTSIRSVGFSLGRMRIVSCPPRRLRLHAFGWLQASLDERQSHGGRAEIWRENTVT